MKNLLILFLLLPAALLAQKSHTVGPKETLFSIGRMYNVHPKELASFNKISFDEGVKIGQVLKIPESKTMAPVAEKPTANVVVEKPAVVPSTKPVEKASEKTAATGTGTPVYHKVQKGETLYQISRKYEGANVANLRKWNNLKADGLNEGMNLIVGYGNSTPVKNEPKIEVAVDKPKVQMPAATTTPAVVNNSPATEPVKSTTPVIESDGGYFKSLYIVQTRAAGTLKSENGMAATFKSNSGWDDGKYYCLQNNAPAGTIIKVVNTVNQKFIYAKVLDVIPDLQQNEGVVIRLSNAAANALGASGDKFQVSLNYQ